MHTEAGYWWDLARGIVGGRPCLIAATTLAGATHLVRALRELGAERPFVIAGSEGTGELLAPGEAESRVLGIREPDFIAEIRTFERALTDLPGEVSGAIERWDPGRRAVALGTVFTPPGRMAGRPTLGGRRAEWAAFEDKTVCDEIWDAANVARLPSEVVPARADALVDARRRAGGSAGSVWSGDNREGHQGGAFYVRWVRAASQAQEAISFFSAHCNRVRVMPFAEGIPCSIHGIVAGDEVAVLRPCELVTLRRPSRTDLVYGGVATYWDPSDDDRAEMRSIARRVGQLLAQRAAYRGAFCIDGVMTADGFRPTELNARMSAGLNVMARSLNRLPLFLIVKAMEEGLDLDYRIRELEDAVVSAADAKRSGGAWTPVARRLERTEEIPLVWQASAYERATGEMKDAVLTSGPSAMGGLVRFAPEPTRTPTGPSIGPRVVAAYALADRELGTGLGPLEPARSVR